MLLMGTRMAPLASFHAVARYCLLICGVCRLLNPRQRSHGPSSRPWPLNNGKVNKRKEKERSLKTRAPWSCRCSCCPWQCR